MCALTVVQDSARPPAAAGCLAGGGWIPGVPKTTRGTQAGCCTVHQQESSGIKEAHHTCQSLPPGTLPAECDTRRRQVLAHTHPLCGAFPPTLPELHSQATVPSPQVHPVACVPPPRCTGTLWVCGHARQMLGQQHTSGCGHAHHAEAGALGVLPWVSSGRRSSKGLWQPSCHGGTTASAAQGTPLALDQTAAGPHPPSTHSARTSPCKTTCTLVVPGPAMCRQWFQGPGEAPVAGNGGPVCVCV